MEGKAINNLITDFSHFLLKWREGDGTEKLPGGESLADLRERAWHVVERIAAKHSDETVVLVSHYFAILTIICAAMGFRLVHLRKMRAQPASITILDINPRYSRLAAFGKLHHLSGTTA